MVFPAWTRFHHRRCIVLAHASTIRKGIFGCTERNRREEFLECLFRRGAVPSLALAAERASKRSFSTTRGHSPTYWPDFWVRLHCCFVCHLRSSCSSPRHCSPYHGYKMVALGMPVSFHCHHLSAMYCTSYLVTTQFALCDFFFLEVYYFLNEGCDLFYSSTN